MRPILQLTEVSKFVGPEQILKDISLTIKEGSFTAVIGPSGSGKSSLLYIMGLLDEPTLGEIRLSGDVIDYSDKKGLADIRNKYYGFIFQFHYLIPELTLEENIILPMLKAGKDKKEALPVARSLAEKFGLKGKEKRRPYQLSGGEQQRVAIARAMANDPLIIFADEPTGNLDSKNTKTVMDTFMALNKEGKTIVLVTHDLELTQSVTEIIQMIDGRIRII